MSSRCAASSSIVCTARSAPAARAWRMTSILQSRVASMEPSASGEFDAGDRPQRRHEPAPVGPLLGQHPAPRIGDPVVTPPALSRFLDPSAPDPAAILHPVERGVERREGESQAAVGALFDEPCDLVSVMALAVDDGENQDLAAALLGFVDRTAARHGGHLHEAALYIPTKTAVTGRNTA